MLPVTYSTYQKRPKDTLFHEVLTFESMNSPSLKSKLFLKFTEVLKTLLPGQSQMSDFHLSKDKVDQKSNSLVSSQSV